MANLVLVDDHALLRNGLADLIKSFGETVLFEADNGRDFILKLDPRLLPDVVLLDINMPEMDGYETCQWLTSNHPSVKVLTLSMYDSENSIIRMLKCGAKGFILKDCEPHELKMAIKEIVKKGYYYTGIVNEKMLNEISHIKDDQGGGKRQ